MTGVAPRTLSREYVQKYIYIYIYIYIRKSTVIVYNGIRNNSPSSTSSTFKPDYFNVAVYFTYSLQNAYAVLNFFCDILSSSMRPIFHLSQQDRTVCAHISTHTHTLLDDYATFFGYCVFKQCTL